MKIVTRMEIILTKRDSRLAEANSGLLVDLPALTDKVLLRVVPDGDGEGDEGKG